MSILFLVGGIATLVYGFTMGESKQTANYLIIAGVDFVLAYGC